jgi:hypothetical protein
MAEQVDVKINITTTEAPPLAIIEQEVRNVESAASDTTNQFEQAGAAARKATTQMSEGFDGVKNTITPLRSLISQLTGGISEAFLQAYETIRIATKGLKGFKLALATTGVGLAVLALSELVGVTKIFSKEEKEANNEIEKYQGLTQATIDLEERRKKAVEGLNVEQEKFKKSLEEINGLSQAELNLRRQAYEQQLKEAKGFLEQTRQQYVQALTEAGGFNSGISQEFIQGLVEQQFLLSQQVRNAEEGIKSIDDALKALKKTDEDFKVEKTNVVAYFNAIQQQAEILVEAIFGSEKALEEQIAKIGENQTQKVQKQVRTLGEIYEKNTSTFADHLKNLNANTTAFYEGEQGKAIKGALGTAAEFTKVLADAQDVSSSAAFEGAKKYKIASVITSAIQSSFEAYGSAQQFGPVLGPILGAAQVAAIALASNKAINDIKNSSFSSPSLPSTTTPTQGRSLQTNFNIVGTSGINQLAQGIGGQFQQPLRAYVVGSDVMGYDELQRRRIRTATFG